MSILYMYANAYEFNDPLWGPWLYLYSPESQGYKSDSYESGSIYNLEDKETIIP